MASNAFDTFTPAMFEAMRHIGKGAATASEIGSNACVLNALCERGMLAVDRGKPNYYTPTPMGIGAIAVLNAPISPKHSDGPVAHIQKVVAHYFGVPVREMTSARRSREVARPRQVAMYLARELTPFSLPMIGKLFGNRDHTTVIHALRVVEGLIEINFRGTANQIADLRRSLGVEEMMVA
jgi:hypothetical protein